MSVNEVIMLRGEGIREEALAYEGVTPGMVIDLNATGKVIKHATAGGNIVPKMVAINDYLQGRSIKTAYTAGELVQYAILRPGDRVRAFLKAGVNYAVNTLLESNGDGTLRAKATGSAASTEPNRIFGRLMVATNLSASGAVNTLATVIVA